jgi:hypothetical protein
MNGITSGPVGSHMLGDISAYDLFLSGVTDIDDYYLKNISGHFEYKNRLNHLGADSNQNMANLIINIINNDDFTPRLIYMNLYFNGLKES